MSSIKIEIKNRYLSAPVTTALADQAIVLLNTVFNSKAFETELSKQSFVASNNPSMSTDGKNISGSDVYRDFMSKGTISISLTVKRLRNLWKRAFSKTMGETDPRGTSIVTYTWWLDDEDEKELLIAYATHVGHEIFHTKYFGYIHDPEIGTRKFVNERDVTYMIDDILEELIKAEVKR